MYIYIYTIKVMIKAKAPAPIAISSSAGEPKIEYTVIISYLKVLRVYFTATPNKNIIRICVTVVKKHKENHFTSAYHL